MQEIHRHVRNRIQEPPSGGEPKNPPTQPLGMLIAVAVFLGCYSLCFECLVVHGCLRGIPFLCRRDRGLFFCHLGEQSIVKNPPKRTTLKPTQKKKRIRLLHPSQSLKVVLFPGAGPSGFSALPGRNAGGSAANDVVLVDVHASPRLYQ